MKKIIRLTERDLTRIVKRTINEMESDDYKDRSMYSPYYGEGDDEEWGETDEGEEELQDLIEEARDFLENECGYDLHDINLMSEEDIIDVLYEEENEELAEEIADLLYQEGFADFDDMPSYKIDREGTRLSKRGEDPFDEYKGFDDEEYA